MHQCQIYNAFQQIQTTKTAISAYEETIKMFREQCSIINGFLDQRRGTHEEHG